MNREHFSLSQWLEWLEQSHPQAIDLGLERIRQVFLRLELDLSGIRLISVAGTNGKGSTIAFMQRILSLAGYRCASYTSPHLLRYNERVQFAGQPASDVQLASAFVAVDAARQDVSLTYFEMGTLAALWLIAQQRPDIALLEVGLGGRLDAVNIVDADVSVLTTVAIDHVDWLGDDREQIGWEKAGIFRPGRAAVCGDLDPPATVAEYARSIGAVLYQAGQDFTFSNEVAATIPAVNDDRQPASSTGGSDSPWCWQGRDQAGQPVFISHLPAPGLPRQNAATALQVLQLCGLECSEQAIRQGIASARVAGRMDQVSYRQRCFILDVAHNPQSAAYLAEQLPDQVILIMGMLADKDCRQVMTQLAAKVTSWHLVTLSGPRGQSAAMLQALLADVVPKPQVNSQCHPSVAHAIESVCADPISMAIPIVVCGSFLTVGQAYQALAQEVGVCP